MQLDHLAAAAPFVLLALALLCILIEVASSVAEAGRRRAAARLFGMWPAPETPGNPEDDLETFQTGAAETPSPAPVFFQPPYVSQPADGCTCKASPLAAARPFFFKARQDLN